MQSNFTNFDSGKSAEDGTDATEHVSENMGVIYVRVSTKPQMKYGDPATNQENRIKEMANSRNIKAFGDPIRDVGKTGTNFIRSGIRKVADLAHSDQISYLLVDNVDRIGRDASESVFYIRRLRDLGVTVISVQGGEIDVNRLDGLSLTFSKSLAAQIEVQGKKYRAVAGRIEGFKEKNWKIAFKNVPLGYQLRDDGWIEPCQNEVNILEQATDFFLQTDIDGAYKKTREATNLSQYGINGSTQLKRMLKKRVYIGEPTYRLGSPSLEREFEAPVVVEDDDLAIIPERKYNLIQEKIRRVYSRHSPAEKESGDLDYQLDKHGIEPILAVSDCIEIRCQRNGCGSKMVKNGERETLGEPAHNYKCTDCGCKTQRKFPIGHELSEMKRLSQNSGEKA